MARNVWNSVKAWVWLRLGLRKNNYDTAKLYLTAIFYNHMFGEEDNVLAAKALNLLEGFPEDRPREPEADPGLL